MAQTVITGLEAAAANSFSAVSGARIAIVANQASVDSKFQHLVDLVVQSGSCKVVRLFAPEHGFRGALQDMAAVEHSLDPITGLPVTSLYGKSEQSLHPQREVLEDLDAVLFDLPDIGTRYYTFAQTLAYTMAACGPLGIKVVLLDRPNPINGRSIEGARLIKSCRSFCGLAPVANRHGMTLGELARLMQRGFGEDDWKLDPIDCELDVIKVEGWSRSSYLDQTSVPWVLPSPNMPTLDTAIVYPGSCLFEATNVSEGRGTTRPFELIGAPFIDAAAWINAVHAEDLELSGAILRPVSFVPQFHKWAGQPCNGVQLHVTDRETFKPLRWGLALVSALSRLYPGDFAWRDQAYEFVKDVAAIDLLYGSPSFRECLAQGASLAGIAEELGQFERWFDAARDESLLYR